MVQLTRVVGWLVRITRAVLGLVPAVRGADGRAPTAVCTPRCAAAATGIPFVWDARRTGSEPS